MDYWHQQLGFLNNYVAFKLNGVRYPSNWLLLSTPQERAALGFKPTQHGQKPNSRFYIEGAMTVDTSGPVVQVTYAAIPKNVSALKTQFINDVKTTARSLLSQDDWQAIRAFEDPGKPITQDVKQWRADIRAATNAHETAVNTCTTLANLEALPDISWPVDPRLP